MTAQFNLDQPEEITKFFETNGFVLITGILSKEECDQTTLETQLHLQSKAPEFKYDDLETYHLLNQSLSNYGLPGKEPIFTKQLIKNRVNPKVHQAFQLLYDAQSPKKNEPKKNEPLLVNHDRFAFYRPTLKHPEWKTPYTYPNLHLDVDPKMYLAGYNALLKERMKLDYNDPMSFIKENNLVEGSQGPSLQGLISVWDNQYNDGGLQLVPGFHQNFQEWYSKKDMNHPAGSQSLWKFNPQDSTDMSYISNITRVPMPAGSIAIWDKRLAHGSTPNKSQHGRLIQFLIMHKRNSFPIIKLKERQKAIKKVLSAINFEPTIKEQKLLY